MVLGSTIPNIEPIGNMILRVGVENEMFVFFLIYSVSDTDQPAFKIAFLKLFKVRILEYA